METVWLSAKMMTGFISEENSHIFCRGRRGVCVHEEDWDFVAESKVASIMASPWHILMFRDDM